ncbi:MAG: ABC-F family ATP-binding cassette domain-containing protein [Candidatus Kerfeldbacteria bacterium]|nr:ABC-F family ATP-binding cassette domain-containing protein [Candidatus Kerfeldbacteria bacterium]
MNHGDVIIRFNNVSYKYNNKKLILSEANFSVRENAKMTIMGQNGAGKSTIFKLMTGELHPDEGEIHIQNGARIAIAKQVMPRECFTMTVKEFFETAFEKTTYDIDRRIAEVLDIVHFSVPLDRTIEWLSGGQQARLLLAHALIQKPDILLLDEPTNNLDTQGIDHLTEFLILYEKTVIVISHDATFLNAFTHGVLHLDAFNHTVRQFVGDYMDVVEEISRQIEREQRQNAQLKKTMIDRKEKVNFFANKGGKMRKLASKLREEIAESEAQIVTVAQEDKTIRPFSIPVQNVANPVVHIREVTIMGAEMPVTREVDVTLRKKECLRITGPNGIGKTTLLETLASQKHTGMTIAQDVRVGYYRQDFSGLDFEQTPFQALQAVQVEGSAQEVYAAAAHFLLNSELLQNPIGSLSEGQKGLLCYARFMLQQPGLLILDEPTNHINFRHLPVIAEALNNFDGAIIVVSHDQEFVDQLEVDHTLDLQRLS